MARDVDTEGLQGDSLEKKVYFVTMQKGAAETLVV